VERDVLGNIRGKTVIDLCCGTGDLTPQTLKGLGTESVLLGFDFNKAVLRRALEKVYTGLQEKSTKMARSKREIGIPDVSFVLADASHLPLRDGYADNVGVSFCLRNLVYENPNIGKFLAEVLRVLRHNGSFICIETSQPTSGVARALFHVYCNKIVPLIGWLVSKNKDIYQYLGMSATTFPPAEEIAALFMKAGFREVSFRRLTFEVTALHVAEKLSPKRNSPSFRIGHF
jgi:demethylmenaquinone methyltransferase/2-methoxy-6-polyprenyl-1,4-benzoquinol methylase